MMSEIITPPLCRNNKRIDWIDTAKSLGIVLVFWGHILYGGSSAAAIINQLIYSFHMPMYFILSGIVAKDNNMKLCEFAIYKYNRVLKPALGFYVLTLPAYFIMHRNDLNLIDCIKDIFYLRGQCAYNDPIWFFICLFQVLLFCKLIKIERQKIQYQIIICMSAFILSLILSIIYTKYSSFIGLNCAILGIGFYTFGILLSKVLNRIDFFSSKHILLWTVIFFLWILFALVLNNKVSMYGYIIGGSALLYFIISGILGSLVFYRVSYSLRNICEIQYFAKYTTIVICSHYVFVSSFFVIAYKFGINGNYLFDVSSFIYVLLVLFAVYKPLCKIIGKHIPWLNGKR